jgi:hypothetical protein
MITGTRKRFNKQFIIMVQEANSLGLPEVVSLIVAYLDIVFVGLRLGPRGTFFDIKILSCLFWRVVRVWLNSP